MDRRQLLRTTACAAVVTRTGRETGRIVALLKELDLEQDTLIVLTSGNGPTFQGGTDSPLFPLAKLRLKPPSQRRSRERRIFANRARPSSGRA
jgi:arylsulfatase A-like enzyme